MAVKNVTFEVTANTENAQASLNALIAQLDQIKKNSTISFSQSTGNIDAQIKSLTTKLDQLAKENQKRIDSETKSVTDSQKAQTNAVKGAIDEQRKAYENFARYAADLIKKEIKETEDAAKKKISIEKQSQNAKKPKTNISDEEQQRRAAVTAQAEIIKNEIKIYEDGQKDIAKQKQTQEKEEKDRIAAVQKLKEDEFERNKQFVIASSKIIKKEIAETKEAEIKAENEANKISKQERQNKINAIRAAAALRRQEIAISKASVKEQAQVEAAAAKATKESTAYFQVSESVKTLTARSRELGAQLILLEQSGQKNSATYKALAKEYATVKAAADKASASLKQLNSNANVQPQAQKLGGLAGAINFISRSVANSSANFVRLQNVIARTGVALGAVSIGAAVLSFGRAAIKAASDYEVLNVSFGTLIGNTTLATAKIKELREFAAATPFTTEDVFQASRTLLGYGLVVGDLIPTIKRLGDIAGGVGVPLERVALVFGQIRAAGRLYGQDLLQLVTLGFNPLSEIARTTGESFDSLKDKMRKGQITFDDVNRAFVTATSEGGKFYNLTNALANTTTAQLARLNEEWTILLTQVGQGLLPAFNALINFGRATLEFFTDLPKTIRENALVFTFLTTATTALTAALFANSLNLVSNSVKTVFNTAAKVANRTATALMAGANVLATNGIRAQTIAQAGLTTGTKLATAAINAFKAAWISNPLGLIITLLSTAAAAWYAFGDAVDEANDGFINADEALTELKLTSEKATKEELKTLKDSIKSAQDITKPLKDRQKIIDEINKKYERSVKLTGDEKKDATILKQLYIDLEGAITDVNKAKAAAPIREKLNQQIADVQLELLNAASQAGVGIPISLITSEEEIQGGFKKTIQIIQEALDKANLQVPNALERAGDIIFGFLFPGRLAQGYSTDVIINNSLLKRANAVETLNVQLERLKSAFGILGALDEEIKGLPDSFVPGGGGKVKTQEEIDAENKERLRKLQEYQKELASLQDRIKKNNEELRKERIEFRFVDAADFEEEIEKLKLLDKVEQERVDREIDREIASVRARDITEKQKTELIGNLEVIRFQEQEKRALNLQTRLYEIERDGVIERRKLALELGALYDELISERAQREVEALDELREQLDDFYNDIYEDDPFSKGRFITAPRIEFGGTEFQFEDIIQPSIEAINEIINSINKLNTTSDKIKLIDEFNAKYGTTLAYVNNEFELQAELSKEYEKRVKQAKDLYNEQNKAPRRQNIFQFARGVQERGQEDPFVKAVEEQQREFITATNAEEKAELDRITNVRNARIQLIQQTATEGNKELEIKIANAEFEKEEEEVKTRFFKKRQERFKKDSDALKANDEEQKRIIKEERDARIQALQDISQAVLDFTATFIDAQIQQTEAAINAQQRRVDAAKEIADKGNAELLELEQQRLDKLNRQRANYVRQQQSLAAVEIAVNSAIAVAQAAGQPGAPFTIAAIIAAMAVGFAQARAQAQAATTFAKGGYTGDGHQFQEAGTVHKGEFVMNAQRTRQYRPLLEAIHSGRHPELAKSVNEKVFVMNSKSTDERLERVEKAILSQKGLQLSIDENGINGIVSRISYKQQRINNRTR